ncbi:MAG: hypothetical protein ACRDGT_05445 [Candidatus Limnocylindria bacterium]
MKTANAELDALLVWALATFHAALFMLVALLFLYWQDVLRNVLPNLNTAVGLGLFVLLWAITWWTTSRAVGETEGDNRLVSAAALWGGLNGVLFLLVAGGGVAIVGAVTTGTGSLEAAAFTTIFLGIGSLFAFVIGAVVGTVFGWIDLALLRLARRLARHAIGTGPTGSRPSGS